VGVADIRRRTLSRCLNRVSERVTGIEPALSAWEADVLPLNYTRRCRQAQQIGSGDRHSTDAVSDPTTAEGRRKGFRTRSSRRSLNLRRQRTEVAKHWPGGPTQPQSAVHVASDAVLIRDRDVDGREPSRFDVDHARRSI
jgi:hypothetical protein